MTDIIETLNTAWVADALENGSIRSTTVAERMIRERHAALLEITKLRAERSAAVDGLLPFVSLADQADEMSKISASVGHNAFEENGLGKLVDLFRQARSAHQRATALFATEGKSS